MSDTSLPTPPGADPGGAGSTGHSASAPPSTWSGAAPGATGSAGPGIPLPPPMSTPMTPSGAAATTPSVSPYMYPAAQPAMPYPTVGMAPAPMVGVSSPRGGGSGMAIAALVAAGLALLASLVALGVALVNTGDSLGGETGSGYYYEAVRGEVINLADGDPLSGEDLATVLETSLADYGAQEIFVVCPDTAEVHASTVVVCRGQVENYDWTGVVFFEDDVGTFVLGEF